MDVQSNILFFLTPKEEVAYVYADSSLGETMEKMEVFRYTSIPVLRRSGEYLGTLTEGDLLWNIKNHYHFDYENAKRVKISKLPRYSDNMAVTISTDMDEVITKAMEQNFVPVEDDRGMFIGIVTRRNILQYFKEKLERSLRDFHIA
ncbi:MAG: CBS domain-containing protein [Clostridiales bacterium]|nr:CBS domain-containing protein [Clostridiales bacterium]